MVIRQKLGAISSMEVGARTIDVLELEWYETNKRIMHKQTAMGKAVSIKFLQQNPALAQGDVLYYDEHTIITISIKPCEAIVLQPANIMEAAAICYEIGNKHLPLFYDADELLVPYEAPLYRLLQASGYTLKLEERTLLHAIKTSVSPHATAAGGSGLFSKIFQLTNPS